MRLKTFRPVQGRLPAGIIAATVCVVGLGPVSSAAAGAAHVRHRGGSPRVRRKARPTHVSPTTALGVTMVAGDSGHRPTQSTPTTRAPSIPSTCQNASIIPTASNVGLIDAATLCLINKARQAAGLVALVEDPALDRAAVAHSKDMVAENYFDHVGPDGLGPDQRVLASGFAGSRTLVAENIAAATLSAATPAATVASWMASPDHRRNILDPALRWTGMGVAAGVPSMLGGLPGGTYTEDFT
ncbi:MAG TPA: CAP domain-containing protein [Solirubrobacteraceae bacterium]|jgi:uncharacterized protein YkwD|nr:CAP domain-containing protein [Solirubrobacteraceae bacterium]